MRERERNRADAIADFRSEMAAVVATLTGDFDSRIKELQKLKKEVTEQERRVKTLKEAEQIKQEAGSYSVKVRAEMDELRKSVEAREAALKSYEVDLRSTESRLRAREETLAHGVKELEKLTSEFNSHVIVMRASLTSREDAIAEKEKQVAAHLSEVADLRAKLSERLRALNAV